jgi:hypothetical protein
VFTPSTNENTNTMIEIIFIIFTDTPILNVLAKPYMATPIELVKNTFRDAE